ncbi:MAG: M23 family metallopeptidase [Bacteroidales bacterium]|nr:M23 family metallopeptidase [Candidatus Minthousia equi]
MHKVYYIYNPRTGCYDRIYPTFKQRFRSYLRRVLQVLIPTALVILAVVYWNIRHNEADAYLADNQRLRVQYAVLRKDLSEALKVMQEIKERDHNLYRVMVQADLMLPEDELTEAEIDYSEFKDSTNAILLHSTEQKAERLLKHIYEQIRSFDAISLEISRETEKVQSIPSIQPVKVEDLNHLSSGFGFRTDPVTGEPKMHTGLDFAAAVGTPIYATGSGVVSFADWKSGYGNCTIIDHGYGYQTLYGHQDEILVKVGQSVKRGDLIGKVGNTGKSTGPHLHYEVMIQGRKVNPVNFFSKELTPEEYDKLLREAAVRAGVFD